MSSPTRSLSCRILRSIPSPGPRLGCWSILSASTPAGSGSPTRFACTGGIPRSRSASVCRRASCRHLGPSSSTPPSSFFGDPVPAACPAETARPWLESFRLSQETNKLAARVRELEARLGEAAEWRERAAELDAVRASRGWRLVESLWRLRDALLPAGSRRRGLYDRGRRRGRGGTGSAGPTR